MSTTTTTTASTATGSSSSADNVAASHSDDCLGCRITGSATLLGVSGYFFFERGKIPLSKAGERRWLLACAGAFAGAGLWRATTGVFTTSGGDGSKH